MERYGAYLRIQSECRKIWTKITPNMDTLRAMFHTRKEASSYNSTQLYTTKIYHNFSCQFLCYLILSFLSLFFLWIFLAKWNNFINFVEIRVNTEFLWKFRYIFVFWKMSISDNQLVHSIFTLFLDISKITWSIISWL